MATPAHRVIQDQNLNFLYNGTAPGGKKTDVAKAEKKGGLGGRKALNDISNSSRKASSGLPTVKKENPIKVISDEKDPFAVKANLPKAPEKGKAGGRKALSDLTNSVKPPLKQAPSTGKKINAVAEDNIPSSVVEERFLHNHQECIRAQSKAVDKEYFMKTVGIYNDASLQLSNGYALEPSLKEVKTHRNNLLEMEDVPAELVRGYRSPACVSPKSPKAAAPYMKWEDDDFVDELMLLIESPKRM